MQPGNLFSLARPTALYQITHGGAWRG